MKRLLAPVLTCCLLSSAFLTAQQIVLSPHAIPAEKTAAYELQAYLRKLSGKDIPIVAQKSGSPAWHVGQSPTTQKLLNMDFKTLKTDEIILRSSGDDMILVGNRPRGTLYAVYDYLERGYGVRFWTHRDETVPAARPFQMVKVNHRYAPPFFCREALYDFVRNHPAFCVKLRNNQPETLPEAWGGFVRPYGWVHTFERFIPAKLHLKSHPEWFSEVDGKRVGGQQTGQLCLTHPQVKAIILRKCREALKKDPAITMISVSQNDNNHYCRCSRCRQRVAQLGNQTDLLLEFVNGIAQALEHDYPTVKIDTLAYLYTRAPAQTVRPHKNVIIRLCAYERDLSKPIEAKSSPRNQSFCKNLDDWSRIAHQLFIWDYVFFSKKPYMPLPNWKHLASDLRYFRKHHAVAVFSEGTWMAGAAADLPELRAWVLSKLLWNPDLEVEKLIQEFLVGYYGPQAAPLLTDYINLVCKAAKRNANIYIPCHSLDCVEWFADEDFMRSLQLFKQAESIVRKQPMLLERVRRAAISIRIAALERRSVLKKMGLRDKAQVERFLDTQFDLAYQSGTRNLTNDWHETELAPAKQYFLNRLGFLDDQQQGPEPADLTQGRRWLAYGYKELNKVRLGTLTFVEKDPLAPTGMTVRLPTEVPDSWALQVRDTLPPMKAEIYLEARIEAKAQEGAAFMVGLYNISTQSHNFTKVIPVNQFKDKRYVQIRLPDADVSSASVLYMCPVKNGACNNIYISRVIFIEK